MSNATDILEIPIEKTKNVDDLVKWFEQKKVYQKRHPSIALPNEENFPALVLFAFVILVGMALMVLEEKGKLKVKSTAPKKSPKDFLEMIKNSKTESKAEKLIEARYNLSLILAGAHHGKVVSEPTPKYNLNDAFGIWKNKNINLDKVREEQWGRKK